MSSEKMKPKIRVAKAFASKLCPFYRTSCDQSHNYDTEIKPESDYDFENSIGETIPVNESSVQLSIESQNKKEDSRDYFNKKNNLRWFPRQEDLHSRENDLCPVIEDINTFTDLIQKPVVVNSNSATHDVVDDIKKNVDRSGEQVRISCSKEDLCVVVKEIHSDVTKEQADSNGLQEVVVNDINQYIDTERDQVDYSVTNEELYELIKNINKSTDILQMPEFSFGDIKRCSEIDEVQMDKNDFTDPKQELCLIAKDNDECTNTSHNAKWEDMIPPQMNSITQYEPSCAPASKITSVEDSILFELNQQVTYDADALIYKIVPDFRDPSLQSTIGNKLSDFMLPTEGSVALNPCIDNEIPHSDDVPFESSISLYDLACQPVITDNDMKPKESSVLLHDVFCGKSISKRKAKDVPLVYSQKENKTENSSGRPTTVNKKAMTTNIKKEKVTKVKPHKYKTKNMPKGSKKTKLRAPIQTSMELPEENSYDDKSLYINDWLQGASQVTTFYDDIDVNEWLKDVINKSDGNIEDDAFELARYMDMEPNCTDSNNLFTNDQNVNNISDSYTQHLNETNKTMFNDPLFEYEMDIDQPLDMSKQQTTPRSTDTGFGDGSSLIEQATSLSNYHIITNNQSPMKDNWEVDIDKEDLVTEEISYSSDKSLRGREELEQQANDQVLIYQATNFNKSVRSCENFECQPSIVKSDENASIHYYSKEQSLNLATNFSKSFESRENFDCQPFKENLDENGNDSIHYHARDQVLSYTAINILSKESPTRSCTSASNSSGQEDDNKMAKDDDSSVIERPLNNLAISKPRQISMISTSEYTEPPIVNSVGQSSKLPIKAKWNAELQYAIDLDHELDESGNDDESRQENGLVQTLLNQDDESRQDDGVVQTSLNHDDESRQEDGVVQTSLNHESRSVATPSDNNYVATSNDNAQPSWNRESAPVITPINTNYVAASRNNKQPSWTRDCKSLATTSDNNQLTQPIQPTPALLNNVLKKHRENIVIKISNNPSSSMSRVVTKVSSLQGTENKKPVSIPFVTPPYQRLNFIKVSSRV